MTALAESGVTVHALENRPVLLPGLDLYFDAYNQLCYDRPVGMTTGFIPWSSLINWCHLHGIHDIDDIETCIRYIRKLENAENEIRQKRAEKE